MLALDRNTDNMYKNLLNKKKHIHDFLLVKFSDQFVWIKMHVFIISSNILTSFVNF